MGHARLRFSILGSLAVATALSGCGGESTLSLEQQSASPSSETASPAPPGAFHFASGDLVLGDFDPYTIGDDLFDPCAEISDEEFAAVGLVEKETDDASEGGESGYACSFAGPAARFAVGVISTPATSDMALQQGKPIDEVPSGGVPGSFVFVPLGSGGECLALVETERGTFGASVSSLDSKENLTDVCALASEILDSLYSLDR